MKTKLITKSFERLLDKGVHRGFITYEELGKSLGKRNSSHENLEKALIILFDKKVTLVSKKSEFQSLKKKEVSQVDSEKSSEKSDDPIRMYLREMGGVELLSRDGEIAIAKRIEAGKNVMINALTQSPWSQKNLRVERPAWKNELLVRDIIDIDSTYEDFENDNSEDGNLKKVAKEKLKNHDTKEKKDESKDKNDEKTEEYVDQNDEFNVSLAAMEEEIKPKVISLIQNLSKNYAKLKKYQIEKLNCILNSKELSVSKNKNQRKYRAY